MTKNYDSSPPSWVKTPEMGAKLNATPLQQVAEVVGRPALGCLVVLGGAVGVGVVLDAVAKIPEVSKVLQATFGK